MADEESKQQYDELISTLPSSKGGAAPLRNFHGFWYLQFRLPGAIAFRERFKPRGSDIVLASPPKSGTTWLKALAFATVNRKQHNPFSPDHPLLSSSPHECAPTIDDIFLRGLESTFDSLTDPRLVPLHMAYSVLPKAVRVSNCKIICICRNLKDTFISLWYFSKEIVVPGWRTEPLTLEEAFEMYCEGVSAFGPVWDYQLEYWKESLQRPEKVLFLKYEDVLEDTTSNLKKLAEFVGYPFTEEEEREGIVDGIVRLCSIGKLRGVEANQSADRGLQSVRIKNSTYFRKGKVGDWKNHLSPEMARRLDEIAEEKLSPYGLSFRDE